MSIAWTISTSPPPSPKKHGGDTKKARTRHEEIGPAEGCAFSVQSFIEGAGSIGSQGLMDLNQ